MLISVVFNCVHVSFISFDAVFWRVLGWLGWIGSFYAVNKQDSVASRVFPFYVKVVESCSGCLSCSRCSNCVHVHDWFGLLQD